MRSEKDQMAVGKEKGVVELQFRDIPREQENTPPKQKEEKKEVFTKVGERASATRRIVYAERSRHGGGKEGGRREERRWIQHRGQRQGLSRRSSNLSAATCQLHPPTPAPQRGAVRTSAASRDWRERSRADSSRLSRTILTRPTLSILCD